MENILREVDPIVTIPYWDWSLWSGQPWLNQVFHFCPLIETWPAGFRALEEFASSTASSNYVAGSISGGGFPNKSNKAATRMEPDCSQNFSRAFVGHIHGSATKSKTLSRLKFHQLRRQAGRLSRRVNKGVWGEQKLWRRGEGCPARSFVSFPCF